MQPTQYKPQDDFTKSLLSSIPTKFIKWMKNLGQLKGQKGKMGVLEWQIKNSKDKKSWIKANDVEISWLGTHNDIYWVKINKDWADNLASNMNEFIALEKLIYDEIQKREDELFTEQSKQHDRILSTLSTAGD